MLNILIADDNIDYARNLMNYINKTDDNIRVYYISANGKETLNILNTENCIDIILLDLKMPYLSGVDIIKSLSLEQIKKYSKSFIIISGELLLINKVREINPTVIYKILPKSLDFSCISNCVNELISQKVSNEKAKSIRENIARELLSIGYSFSHIGTQYLIDIIEMLYICGTQFIKNLNKFVYPIIAKRYNQTNNNIKISIIRATESMYYNCDEKELMNYFNLNTITKPNIKTVINSVLLKVTNSYMN